MWSFTGKVTEAHPGPLSPPHILLGLVMVLKPDGQCSWGSVMFSSATLIQPEGLLQLQGGDMWQYSICPVLQSSRNIITYCRKIKGTTSKFTTYTGSGNLKNFQFHNESLKILFMMSNGGPSFYNFSVHKQYSHMKGSADLPNLILILTHVPYRLSVRIWCQ